MVDRLRLKEIISNFNGKKIAVIGEMILDEYIIGKVERISPEAPVPVVDVESEYFTLGGAANVINNLCSVKAEVLALGVIGRDKKGEILKEELVKRKVNIEGIFQDKDRDTIIKKRILSQHQQLIRLDWEKKNDIDSWFEEKLITTLHKNIDEINAIIFSDYGKGILTSNLTKNILDLASRKGKIVIVDPKPKNKLNYVHATSMTPNSKEAMECLGVQMPQDEIEFNKLGLILKEKLKLKHLVITRGEKGMTVFADDGIENIPTFAKEVYDVTGAGDTVIAIFTLALVSGATVYEAAKIANAAAGIVVGRVGTSIVTQDEIVEFYEELYQE